MITRYEETDTLLLVESRYAGGRRAVLPLIIAGLVAAALMFAIFVGVSLAAEPGTEFPPRLLGTVIAIGLAPLFLIPRFTRGSERIGVRDTQVVHERFVGKRRTERNEYDLLQMKGLRSTAPEGPQLETEWAGLGFWYRTGPRWFGDTLTGAEREKVVASLLEFEARARSALGLDPAAGLANVGYWDSPEAREVHLQEIYSDQRFLR